MTSVRPNLEKTSQCVHYHSSLKARPPQFNGTTDKILAWGVISEASNHVLQIVKAADTFQRELLLRCCAKWNHKVSSIN